MSLCLNQFITILLSKGHNLRHDATDGESTESANGSFHNARTFCRTIQLERLVMGFVTEYLIPGSRKSDFNCAFDSCVRVTNNELAISELLLFS